jgi:hypothetical protein
MWVIRHGRLLHVLWNDGDTSVALPTLCAAALHTLVGAACPGAASRRPQPGSYRRGLAFHVDELVMSRDIRAGPENLHRALSGISA